MSIKEAKTCPRKAFLHNNIPSGVKKASVLRKISQDVLLTLPLNAPEADVNCAVDAQFAVSTQHMLGFEAESERLRMRTLLWRYLEFEKTQGKSKILSSDFSNTVHMLGKDHMISAHRLIDRGTEVECIRYFYTAPQLNYRGQTEKTKPNKDADLLALQKCGEAELAKLGINKPVFGAFYHLKACTDTSKELAKSFELSRGDNIINYHFSGTEERALEASYSGVQESASVCSNNSSDCTDCGFKNLCQTEFVKRKLAELPSVEETALDQIHMTPQQRQFVMFENGQCRVNAVAGSGKTTIVTLRTLRLIEEGCLPDHILMVTFTEKACQEMRSRLRRYAKGSSLSGVNIDTDKIVVETFNSFGQKLLDQHYAALGFQKNPELVDEVVKKDILVDLLEKNRNLPLDYKNPFMNLPNASGAVTKLHKLLDTLKANHVETVLDVKKLLDSTLTTHAAQLLKMYEEYNTKLVDRGLIDYEDQIRLLLQLKVLGVFETLPFRHIVIDEFQDCAIRSAVKSGGDF